MHSQWQAVEEECSRLIALIKQGPERNLDQCLDSMTPEHLRTVVTHVAKDGSTVFHLAAVRERLDSVRAMIKKGVDINIRDGSRSSALHACLNHNALTSARLLINNGADVNELVSQQTGESLLHKMIKSDRIVAVEVLLDSGSSLEAMTREGDSPLHYTARYNRAKLARYLVGSGAKMNAANTRQETPLHVAIAHQSMEVARTLVKHKASLTSKDCQGMSALHVAVASGSLDLVRLMLTHNSTQVNSKEALLGRTPLLMACSCSNHKMAALLLSHGADANLTTHFRKSVLHVAACSGNTSMLGAVIKHTTNLNALAINNKTPLHYAVTEGHYDIAKMLLKAGASVNLKDMDGHTALHMASSAGNNDIINLFLEYGVHVNATNMQQQTALHMAYMMGHEQIGRILIEAGCDPNMLDIQETKAQEYLQEFQRKIMENKSVQTRPWFPKLKTSRVSFSSQEPLQAITEEMPHGDEDSELSDYVRQGRPPADFRMVNSNKINSDRSAETVIASDLTLVNRTNDLELQGNNDSPKSDNELHDESNNSDASSEEDHKGKDPITTVKTGGRSGGRKRKSSGARHGQQNTSKARDKYKTTEHENPSHCGRKQHLSYQRQRKVGTVAMK